MPLSDYGRFYQAFALGNPAIGPAVARLDDVARGKQVGGGVHYGLGTFVRPTAVGGGNFWHWGAWTYTLPGASDGPLKTSYSSFAVRWGDDRRQHRGAHRSPRLAKAAGRTSSTAPWRNAAERGENWP